MDEDRITQGDCAAAAEDALRVARLPYLTADERRSWIELSRAQMELARLLFETGLRPQRVSAEKVAA